MKHVPLWLLQSLVFYGFLLLSPTQNRRTKMQTMTYKPNALRNPNRSPSRYISRPSRIHLKQMALPWRRPRVYKTRPRSPVQTRRLGSVRYGRSGDDDRRVLISCHRLLALIKIVFSKMNRIRKTKWLVNLFFRA